MKGNVHTKITLKNITDTFGSGFKNLSDLIILVLYII